jgi:hypothetical protein
LANAKNLLPSVGFSVGMCQIIFYKGASTNYVNRARRINEKSSTPRVQRGIEPCYDEPKAPERVTHYGYTCYLFGRRVIFPVTSLLNLTGAVRITMDATIQNNGEPNCEICARGESHARGPISVGEYAGIKIAVCPNTPTDESACTDCNTDMTGELAAVVTDGEPADMDHVVVCGPCLSARVKGVDGQ